MEDYSKRLTPEEALKIAGAYSKRGKLKVFIGYAPGVGKTYTMLNEGNRRLQRGEDVVLGYAESHGRADTDKQIGVLEVIPRKKIEYAGKTMVEMDTEAIIKRHPSVVLVDELAHTNVPGSKNKKRYEDVSEILDAGINVVTTLNVQHLESLNDVIKQITGVIVRETIPDNIVERADEVVAVDITVDALLNRLKRGDVYKKEKITDALANFFREGNLNALREISLRQTAQEVDEDLELYMKAHGIRESWQTTERIMVCISPSPNAKKLIRRGALIARRYRCEWLVAAVENSGIFASKWSAKDKSDIENNFKLARQLGAGTIILSGGSISGELANYAKEKHITQIVIGHSEKSPFQSIFTGSTTGKLLSETKNVAIHVIPTASEASNEDNWYKFIFGSEMTMSDFWKTVLMIVFVSAVNFVILPFIGYQAVGYVFLLALLVLSLFVSFIHIVLFALMSGLIWNFFFIPPLGTFVISKADDMILNFVYIITAIITGYLTSKIKRDEKLLALREAKTDTMHKITSVIVNSKDRYSCIEDVEKEIGLILRGTCKVIVKNDKLKFDETLRHIIVDDEKELSVALWAFENGKIAGWSSETLSFARGLYIPLSGPSEKIGILFYRPEFDRMLSQEEQNFLAATANQLAIYLERELFRERAVEAQELKKSEALYQAILDSVSHELRTPVTSIIGIASALNSVGDEGKKQELINDLKNPSERLDRIITNLLDMSKITSGILSVKKDWQDINELISVSINNLKDKLLSHKIKIDIAEGIPLIKVDFILFEQVLSNLLLNAINYTPDGTEILIQGRIETARIIIKVSDNGQGIKDEDLPFIFDKFYRSKDAPSGGTGLGLAIAKAIVEAHGGEISAYNKKSEGLEIKISLPVEPQPEFKELPNE